VTGQPLPVSLPPWRARAGARGGILFTSSIAASAPGPNHATSAASKAFLRSFAEALRYEMRDTGVTITAPPLGPTDTGSSTGPTDH
jgi:uncharacterized protein